MSLCALPTELKLGFVHYLDPDSTLWFALTCKEHTALCKSNLQAHARRLAERQCIDTHHGNALLWQLLLQVLEDPSIGWYVRELNLPSTRQYSWCEDDDRPAPAQLEQHIFGAAAQKLQELYPILNPGDEDYCSYAKFAGSNNMTATIQDRIQQGYEDGIIILLLHYLPLLDTIRLTAIDDEGLKFALYRITREYKRPSSALPLRHLKTFAIAHWDTEFCCNPDWACILSSLPSLTTLVARQMGNEPSDLFRDNISSPDFVPSSNLTELFLQQCQFDAEQFEVILANIKCLNKFTYVAGGATVSDCTFEPKKIIRALEEYAAHSLEELVLEQEDYSEDGNLRTTTLILFKRLRKLDCAWRILRPMDSVDGLSDTPLSSGFHTADSPPSNPADLFDVRTILPASLEKLYLHGLFDEGSEGTQEEWDFFEHMFDEPSALTPKLTRESVWIGRMALVGWAAAQRIGEAEEPVPHWSNPSAELLEGHGQ